MRTFWHPAAALLADFQAKRCRFLEAEATIRDAQPLATIELPVRVPFGFHGGWIPDPR